MSVEGWRVGPGACAVLVVLSLGIGYAIGARATSTPPPRLTEPKPPAAKDIRVQVSGAVNSPGVYSLRSDQRVEDAIAAAGGVRPDASALDVNLAAKLTDGQSIHVPEPLPAFDPPAQNTGQPTQVSLNSATIDDLVALPGIGHELAERVIEYRDKNGGFRDVNELVLVGGIGPKLVEQLRPLVRL